MERLSPGSSSRFVVELVDGGSEFYEIKSLGDKVLIRASSYVNAAVAVRRVVDCGALAVEDGRWETNYAQRYAYNYCTFSYSMAFWDWPRWEREIDWLAMHGVNMPLAAVGLECVWRNMLLRLGYSESAVGEFIAGPAFLAWWAMNNLEGWGGPLPLNWYAQQEELQRKILARMREYGMEPILPGYAGMRPSQNSEGQSAELKLWNGFQRPDFMLPNSPEFEEWAQIYYEEQAKLFGCSKYYSMDPFHELGGEDAEAQLKQWDLGEMARKIYEVLPGEQPVWVIQGWSENPREEVLAALKPGQLLVLDLFSECRPQWGAPSIWKRENGYGAHNYLFCLLENFGANVGLHGRMDQLLRNWSLRTETCSGIGFTMEGSGTNDIMYDLLSDLLWEGEIDKEQWVRQWVRRRYGLSDPNLEAAWVLLSNTILNCPAGNNQQGPRESIFCARPSLNVYQVSSWSKMQNYYEPDVAALAAELLSASPVAGNDRYEYDLIDVQRQAIADHARVIYNRLVGEFKSGDSRWERSAEEFMALLYKQDSLLSSRPEFMLDTWLAQARSLGTTEAERALYEWNARVQITTWGNRFCANQGKLRDYAHKEWSGLLREFYAPRWEAFFEALRATPYCTIPRHPMEDEKGIDYYELEEKWVKNV